MFKEILGAGLAQHLKAYIADEVATQLGHSVGDYLDDSTNDIAESSSAQVFFVDPFEVARTPLSLSLPSAYSEISPTLAAHENLDIAVISVSATDWDIFYRRLISASLLRAEFLETATKLQERFGFSYMPEQGYSPEIVNLLAGEGLSGLSHWINQHGQVFSAVLLLMYEAGKIPKEYRQ